MDNKYYTYLDGQKDGPMSAADVLRKSAALAPGQALNVWSAELKDWKPIGECLDFVKADAATGQVRHSPAVGTSSGKSSKTAVLWASLAVVILAVVGGTVVFLQERAAAAERERAATAEQVVGGKILIVQKNAEVRKLALVKVDVIRKEDALKWFASVQPAADSKLSAAKGFTAKSLDDIIRVRHDADALVSDFSSKASEMGSLSFNLIALESSMRLQRRGASVKDLDEKRESIRKQIVLLSKYLPEGFAGQFEAGANQRVYAQALAAKSRGFSAILREAREMADKPERYMQSLVETLRAYSAEFSSDVMGLMYVPPASIKRVASATSDGDGLFSLKLPPGEYYAIAMSSRQVVVSPKGDNAIMLGNQNLEASDPSVCLWPADLCNGLSSSRKQLEAGAASLDEALKAYKANRPDAVVEKTAAESEEYFNKMKATL
jgi:hypothetical protein